MGEQLASCQRGGQADPGGQSGRPTWKYFLLKLRSCILTRLYELILFKCPGNRAKQFLRTDINYFNEDAVGSVSGVFSRVYYLAGRLIK